MPDKNSNTASDYTALTPAELMKIHVSNPNHIITEDEMKNLKVGAEAERINEFKRKTEEKETEDDCHNHENNPFDILDA